MQIVGSKTPSVHNPDNGDDSAPKVPFHFLPAHATLETGWAVNVVVLKLGQCWRLLI